MLYFSFVNISATQKAYTCSRQKHWNTIALNTDSWKGWGGFYHYRLKEIFSFLVTPGMRVLEMGCGQGDLLADLKPSFGVGLDFSRQEIERAKRKHPELNFVLADALFPGISATFDVIILSDLVNDLWDVQQVLENIAALTTPHTRIILNFYNRFWEIPLSVAEKIGLAKPNLTQNWLTPSDVNNLLYLSGYESIHTWSEILLPFRIPILEPIINRFLVKIWPFHFLALTNFIIARPCPQIVPIKPLVSVIIPARNEAGNIANIINRVPEMGSGTELVFVEGNSQDDTLAVIQQAVEMAANRRCILLQQTGKGKGDAVRLGFSRSSGDILMILDADLTVPPEDLPRFYEALVTGRGEFINGVRLVYPMEQQAMRFLNLVGNKLFSLAFTWLLGQPVKDTLCGTKVLWRKSYNVIAANRHYFGDFDPFGDFDLLFGAARLNLKIVDLPIRYRERTYGKTNISRWSHGWLLIKMVLFAAGRIKFI